MKKALLVSLGVVAIGAGYLALAGFRGGCGHGGHDPARMERMITNHLEDTLEDLQATPEQRAKIVAVKDRLVARARELHQGQKGVREELVAQWDAANPDAAKVHALIDERGDSMKGLAHEVADALAEVHAILTPEQRAKVSKRLHRHLGE